MSVASKNLYALLGNDEEDSDGPKAPVKTVDKTSTHTVKRNTDGQAPSSAPISGNRRGGGQGGSEAAFRDRNAGSDSNRTKSTEEFGRGGPRGGHGARVRGGRGSRYPRDRDDRHTKNGPGGGSDKQAAQSWGAAEGAAELKDEQAGEDIAQTEKKADEAEKEGEPAEPEEKHVSYADYLAQQAEKKLALEGGLSVRKANEGSKVDKKWAGAKELVKDDDEDFISGSGGKNKRERERKAKQLLDIDQRYVEPERPRGGASGGPSGRGGPRGDFRGGRGESRGGASRGSGPSRGGPPRGGGARGDFRGGRGGAAPSKGASQAINTNDKSAFPSLGS